MSDLDTALEGCRASHRRLFATLEGFDAESARRPSRLPDWSVGHVLSHLARNADSHVRMLQAAASGQAVEQYAGGWDQRVADIEAGSGRPTGDLVEDVRSSAVRLEDAWDATPADVWRSGHGFARGRPWPCADLPLARWREVEVHHADLGAGYDVGDWPDEYVTRDLPKLLATLPDRVDPDARRRMLAWLLGRRPETGPVTLDRWER
jgi:maleylpyruvate isomerase